MNKVVFSGVVWLSFSVMEGSSEASPVDRRGRAAVCSRDRGARRRDAGSVARRDRSRKRSDRGGHELIDELIRGRTKRLASNRHRVAKHWPAPQADRYSADPAGAGTQADLAEHIAQRAVFNLGAEMSPLSRGIVQRMTEVALEMWKAAVGAFGTQIPPAISLDEDDEEIDILHERLTGEVARGQMPTAVAAQVTLLARFYERLGDHAVNIASRIANLPPPACS